MATKTQKGKAYFSFDIEADGPGSSVNSMLSIGIYAFDRNGKKIDIFQRNIVPPPNRIMDEATKKEFWDKHPKMWKFVQTNQVSAFQCMKDLGEFYLSIKQKGYASIEWVAFPAAYDWQWLNTYYSEFGSKNKPYIGFKATCASTLFNYYCKLHKIKSKKDRDALWDELKEDQNTTHNSLDDAMCQGRVFFNLITKKMKIKL
jgi:hypothetical protein